MNLFSTPLSAIKMTSLSNYPERPTEAPSTPRSVLACKKAAVNPSDLIYKPLANFERKYPDPSIAKIHFEKADL